MREGTTRNFGLLIAYIVPGFIALIGFASLSDDIRNWLNGSTVDGPTLGGFLYVTVASICGGMITNAVRWAIIDTGHHLTGVERPTWSFSSLHERLTAYEWLVENHYRHYQFYGNTLCGVAFAYVCWKISLAGSGYEAGWIDGVIAALSCVLVAGSRTTLIRYYERVDSLLGSDWKEQTPMANGGQHHDDKPKKQTKTTDTKAKAGTAANPKKTGK